ncbi:hypothetical protein JCM6882_007357 [Rhodosporidiobolus microsporus]
MLTAASTTLPLALTAVAALAGTASAHYSPSGHGHGHVARSHHSNRGFFPARPALNALHRKRSARARRGEPESLMPGTLTSSEGCTQFAHVESGDWCIKVVDAIEGMTLDKFYEMNPQIDGECHNLWAGYDVCVSTTAKAEAAKLTTSEAATSTEAKKTTTAAPTTTTEAAQTTVAKAANVKVAAVKTSTTTSAEPKTTTTSAAPVQTSAAAAESDEEYGDEDDEDWVCDDEEESSSAAPASTSAAAEKVQEWTSSAAPTTTSKWVEPTTTTTITTSKAAAATKVADTSSANVLAASGITQFLGENTNAILSWYNANSASDSTNGRGWCEFNYNNDMPGFAPSLNTMLKTFNYDSQKAKNAYCGLEAVITTPDGREATMYIVDAFDDTWVRTPSSLDILHGVFSRVYGSWTDSKNDVVQGASWKLTGNRKTEYGYKSAQYQS